MPCFCSYSTHQTLNSKYHTAIVFSHRLYNQNHKSWFGLKYESSLKLFKTRFNAFNLLVKLCTFLCFYSKLIVYGWFSSKFLFLKRVTLFVHNWAGFQIANIISFSPTQTINKRSKQTILSSYCDLEIIFFLKYHALVIKT